MEKNLRHLESPFEFFKLFFTAVRAMRSMRKTDSENRISPTFSERISLAVSGVNECAYCSWRHTKTSLEKGMTEDEIKELLKGNINTIPDNESIALLYAQHFAETKGNVSNEARKRVVDYYGENKTQYIEKNIQAVYFGNMCSNTAYAFKNKLIDKKPDLKLRLTYYLSLPIANSIKKAAGNQKE